MHPDTIASLCVVSALVAAIAGLLIGYLLGKSEQPTPVARPRLAVNRDAVRRMVASEIDEQTRQERSKREWMETNIADLWAHVNDIEEDLPPWHRRAGNRGDDTDIERD